MNVLNHPINALAETVSYVFDSTDTFPVTVKLDYFAFSMGLQNNTANDMKVWVNRYGGPDDYILVPAGSYKEIATTTNFFKVEGTIVGSETISIDLVRALGVDTLLTPVYPTAYSLAADNNLGVDIKLNPINLGGWMWTPWVTSSGEASISHEEAVLNVEYWFNGDYVSRVNSTDFYEDFFALFMGEIVNLYPPGYVPPVNPDYDPVQFDEVTKKIKEYMEAFNAPINDEYIEGWASMDVYDQGLAVTKVTLDASTPASQYQTPFEVLGWTVRETTGTNNATVEASSNGVIWQTISLAPGGTDTSLDPTRYWRVTSGSVELTFSGRAVKMIEFAPIINIFHPVAMDETTGAPADALASWQNYLSDFRDKLSDAGFSGRVVYWKSIPFYTEQRPAWSADFWRVKFGEKASKLVWDAVRNYAWNWTAHSRMEEDFIQVIIQENYNYYVTLGNPLPTTLDDIITDPNVSIQGVTSPPDKLKLVTKIFLEEYSGAYSRGGLAPFFELPR